MSSPCWVLLWMFIIASRCPSMMLPRTVQLTLLVASVSASFTSSGGHSERCERTLSGRAIFFETSTQRYLRNSLDTRQRNKCAMSFANAIADEKDAWLLCCEASPIVCCIRMPGAVNLANDSSHNIAALSICLANINQTLQRRDCPIGHE